MRVLAKAKGLYASQRRYPGDKFEIDPKHFSKVWMAGLDGESGPPPVPEAPAEVTAEPTELDALRAQYVEKFGKKPFHGWDAEKLKEKLA